MARLVISIMLASAVADDQRLRGAQTAGSFSMAHRSGGRHTSFAPYQMGEPPGSSGTDVVGVLRQAEAELFLQCDYLHLLDHGRTYHAGVPHYMLWLRRELPDVRPDVRHRHPDDCADLQ